MASLNIPKLDDETLRKLHARAARHGVSVEEEARRILCQAVTAPERLGDMAVRLFGPCYGDDVFSVPQRELHDPSNLSE